MSDSSTFRTGSMRSASTSSVRSGFSRKSGTSPMAGSRRRSRSPRKFVEQEQVARTTRRVSSVSASDARVAEEDVIVVRSDADLGV